MHLRRVQKNMLSHIPALYYSTVVYLIGSFVGSVLICKLTSSVSYDLFRFEPSYTVVQCFFYYALIVYFARSSLGIFVIPMLLLVKGFSLSATIGATVRWSSMTMLQTVMNIAIPSVIQVFALFYLSSVCFVLSKNRMRHIPIKREQVTQLKGAITFAFISLGSCAVLNLFIYP